MKRQLLDAKLEGGFINNEDDSLAPNYLPVLGYPHAAQPRQNEESLPVPLPMFKRLRITSGVACSPHDFTSITTIGKAPNTTEIRQEPQQSFLYSFPNMLPTNYNLMHSSQNDHILSSHTNQNIHFYVVLIDLIHF